MKRDKGTVYCLGVGPGDPELMTLKACRLIRENSLIAVPGRDACDSAAYQIAVQAVPELESKELIAVDMPMTRDEATLEESHRKAADAFEKLLDTGRNVVYLTLGDPSIYSSFTYIQRLLEGDGYAAELVSGVPSFCAAAARLGISLAERDETFHVVPTVNSTESIDPLSGSIVIMKTGRNMSQVKEMLRDSRRDIMAVEKCGMDGEKIYSSLDEIPDDAGYFTLIIAGDRKETE